MRERAVRVLNSSPTWLPSTSPWLFNQVRLLPADRIAARVVAEQRWDTALFGLGIETYFEDLPRWWQLAEKALRRSGVVRQLPFYGRVTKTDNPDIFHSHWGDQGWRDIPIARGAGIPHVVTFYGKDVEFLPRQDSAWKDRYAELFASCALVLCEGPFMAMRLMQLGCPGSKVQVHRLGVDVSQIPFASRSLDADAPFRVLMAASFREKKGLTYALEALGKTQEMLPGLDITIIGDASPDPRSHHEKKAILETIDRYGLADRVTMLGYQPYDRLMSEAYLHDVFMSPSVTAADGDTEGGAPVALIDMAATGIPIISSTHCDIPQVIDHGTTGLLAPERDSDTLAQHVLALARSRELGRSLAREGRARIETLFDARRQAESLATVYEAVAQRPIREPRS